MAEPHKFHLERYFGGSLVLCCQNSLIDKKLSMLPQQEANVDVASTRG
jgi:hypothetical protein